MSHQSTSLAGVEDPAETFGEIVRRIDYTRDVAKGDVAIGFPILDGEVLDSNVSGTFCWNTSVDHLDGRFVVAVQWSGSVSGKSEVG